jgi:hypothetical protein
MLKVVVKTQEPKDAPHVEPVVPGVYLNTKENEYRLLVRIDDRLQSIMLRNGALYDGHNALGDEAYIRCAIADGWYVLVENAELHITPKEGA